MSAARPAHRIYNFPGWQDNAYVQLLQADAVADGWELAGRPGFLGAITELTSPERDGVVHVQWPSPITEDAVDLTDAFRRADIFADAIHTAKQFGRPVLWTVHNVLPHDSKHPRAAAKLHAALARHADAVHVLTARTAELAKSVYDVDEAKIVRIPHSSYAGVYGPDQSRDTAREKLDVTPEATGVLFFGWIRPYKGIDTFAGAIEIAARKNDALEVLLAGRRQGAVDDAVESLENGTARVISHFERVADEDVPTWFCAADVIVLPYQNVLNSGTMYLAATYGLPTILPDEPHLIEEFGEEAWIRFFDRNDAEASIAGLLAQDWYREEAAVSAARTFASERAPEKMAGDYLALLERLVAER